jgi:hypothetical protein
MEYQRLKNVVILVTAMTYFAVMFPGRQTKRRILCAKLLAISLRFFGIPPFRLCSLTDGIRKIL